LCSTVRQGRCQLRDGEVPPGPGTGPRQGAGASGPPSSPPRGPTLMHSWPKHASLRPSSRRSTARCGCFTPPSLGKPPRAANAHASWADRPAIASTPTSTSTIRARPHERARSSLPPQRCYGPCPPLDARGKEPAPRGAGAYRASDRPTGRKLGVPHPSAGERAGRRGCARPRAIGAYGRHSGASRQPEAHVDQGAAPRHTRASPRWRRPQRHQRPADGQCGDAGDGGLPPGWALR
jgi:hypothetical protein